MDIHAVRADDLRYLVALANTGRLVAAATARFTSTNIFAQLEATR